MGPAGRGRRPRRSGDRTGPTARIRRGDGSEVPVTFHDAATAVTPCAVPIVVMGALLGNLGSGDGPRAQAAATRLAGHVGAVATFTAVFVAGRLGLQMAEVIDSALLERPGATVVWTIAMGVTIGVFHRLLGDSVAEVALAPRAAAFGLGVFGVNWALFMVFVPMVFPDTLADVVLRVGIDIGLVTLACLLVDTRGRLPVRPTPGSRGHTRAPVG